MKIKLFLVVLIVIILQACEGKHKYFAYKGLVGEKDAFGNFTAYVYYPKSADGRFGGDIPFLVTGSSPISQYALEKYFDFSTIKTKPGPRSLYDCAELSDDCLVWAVWDGVYGYWNQRYTGMVEIRAVITDHTGPTCANGLPCNIENSDPNRFTFNYYGKDVPITTIVELPSFPGVMRKGAFDPIGDFYVIPDGVDPNTLSWRINSMGRFDWQQDLLNRGIN